MKARWCASLSVLMSCTTATNGKITDTIEAADTAVIPNPSTVRVAFIADTHIIGPQYICCSESAGIDNASIMKTPERLQTTIDIINGVSPPVEHVFVLGDVVHDAHHSSNFEWYTTHENAFSRAAALFSNLNAPVHYLWGNHDYDVRCGGGSDHHSREFTHDIFRHFFGAEPYDSIDISGWRFILLNSQLGPTWDASHEKCDTEMGSFGDEQLAWLDAQLSENHPSIVMTHHHMISSTATDENVGPNKDLSTVLARHDNLEVHLAGHLHRWIDINPTESHPVRHIILGSTRYDTDNFWIAEFDATGDFNVLDYEKPKWATTCANTWTYSGEMTPVPDATEQGDCGSIP